MTGRGKLSDAELSKKLGHYQKMSRVWILVGLFGALSGTVSYFAVQDTALKAILTGVLFFGGVDKISKVSSILVPIMAGLYIFRAKEAPCPDTGAVWRLFPCGMGKGLRPGYAHTGNVR